VGLGRPPPPPTRAAARGLATAVALLIAMGPGVGALLVALGPGPIGGEAALAAGAHRHEQASFETSIKQVPGSGRNGSHFVVPVSTPPRQTVLGVGLVVGTAMLFLYGAVGYLRRRSAPAARAERGAPIGDPKAAPAFRGSERGLT
jgi:hypothetical protein